MAEHIGGLASRFAAQGYVTLTPDRYDMQGTPNPDNIDEVIRKMFGAPQMPGIGRPGGRFPVS